MTAIVKQIAMTAAVVSLSLHVATAAAQDQLYQMDDKKPELNVCSGKQGGNYFNVGSDIEANSQPYYKVSNIPSDGSVANMKGLLAVGGGPGGVMLMGEEYPCHIIIVQEDAVQAGKEMLPSLGDTMQKVRTLYPEPILFITRDSGLDDLDDFVDTDRKIAIVEGSGPEVTLQAWAVLAERYRSVLNNVVRLSSWVEALNALGDGRVDGVFYVGAYDVSSPESFASMVHDRGFHFADAYSRHLDDSGVYTQIDLDIEDRWSHVDTMVVYSMIAIHKGVAEQLKTTGYYDLLYAAMSRAADSARMRIDLDRYSGLDD